MPARGWLEEGEYPGREITRRTAEARRTCRSSCSTCVKSQSARRLHLPPRPPGFQSCFEPPIWIVTAPQEASSKESSLRGGGCAGCLRNPGRRSRGSAPLSRHRTSRHLLPCFPSRDYGEILVTAKAYPLTTRTRTREASAKSQSRTPDLAMVGQALHCPPLLAHMQPL